MAWTIIIVLVIAMSGCKGQLHKQISLDEVETIILWGIKIPEGYNGRKATENEAKEIIEWFNSAFDISENKDFAGITPNAGIRIDLKSGEKISIFNTGKDFEVQRNDVKSKDISYWAKEQNIEQLLKDLGGEFPP